MKLIKKLFCFTLFVNSCTSHVMNASNYLVSMLTPYGLDTENVMCLYHGTPLPFKDHYVILPEPGARYFFTLIITARLNFNDEGNTVIITRQPGISCAWYNLSLVYDSAETYKWKIEPVPDADMPMRIPEHCSIIVLMPPQCVEGLEQPQPQALKSISVIHLPKIKLKKELKQDYLDLVVANTASMLPDIKCFCSSQNVCVCKRNNGLIIAPENG